MQAAYLFLDLIDRVLCVNVGSLYTDTQLQGDIMKVKTKVKAGGRELNHNVTVR